MRLLPALLCLLATTASAVPMQFTHQGRLLDPAGSPINGSIELNVALYAAPDAGSALWDTTQTVQALDGHYTLTLGDDPENNPLDSGLFDDGTLYLQLAADTAPLGDRQALVGVPVAAHAYSVSGAIQLTDAQAACDDAADSGRMRLQSDNIQVCLAGEWRDLVNAPLGARSNPGTSCSQILNDRPGVTDGAYWLDPDGAGAFEAYCDMDGGWTLVLMVQAGDDATFDYYSPQWEGTTALNGDVLDPNEDTNMRSLAYSRLPVSEVRFDLGSLGNSLVETYTAASTRELLLGSARSTPHSRTDFLNWLDVDNSNWANQPNCNARGIQSSGPDPANCRYGLIMNNENNCSSADSAVGIGCHTNNHFSNNSDIRFTAAGGHRWSPTVRYERRAWIWAR